VGSLPVGDYTIVTFSHSAVTQTFNNAEAVAVKIR
jgi:hypothetical protein